MEDSNDDMTSGGNHVIYTVSIDNHVHTGIVLSVIVTLNDSESIHS